MISTKRCIGFLIGLGLAGAAAAQQPIVLRWGDVVGGGHPQVVMIERVAAEVKAKTNGRVDIQGFPGGQMGSSRDMIEAVANGTQQLITEGAANFGAWIPSISVTEAPFIWKNPAHLIKDGRKSGAEILLGKQGVDGMRNGLEQFTLPAQPVFGCFPIGENLRR